MDGVKATARLRRAFRYPDDDTTTSSSPEAMDEEEQESLIQTLAAENAARNTQFQYLLLGLALLAGLPFLPALFSRSTSLLALLALTSLSSTAYLLWTQPPTATGIARLDDWAHPAPAGPRPGADAGGGRRRGRASSFSYARPHRSPLEAHLPLLNAALCGVLVLMGAVTRAGGAGWVGLGNLPAVVYGVVLLAKVVMAGVDPERELEGLKYEYKGA